MKELFIGLMSGTSIDAIDAALIDCSGATPTLIATHQHTIPKETQQSLSQLCQPGDNEINRLGALNTLMGELFAEASLQLLQKAQLDSDQITAIGCHGQTIRHHPHIPFTLQIGDPNIIAARTNITTVADFRRKDLANGGEGAPLTPVFHRAVLHSTQTDRIILNIGGIANITCLKADDPHYIQGFDTGPGNTLMDQWILQQKNFPYDQKGKWAASGSINHALLQKLLQEPFFKRPAPKSTGRETFNLPWLQKHLTQKVSPEDIQATLTELTAQTIRDAIPFKKAEILVCGGGAHNDYLMQRLSDLMPEHQVTTTTHYGIDADWVEAMAFAWLAKQTLQKQKLDLTKITGAEQPGTLGGIYYP